MTHMFLDQFELFAIYPEFATQPSDFAEITDRQSA